MLNGEITRQAAAIGYINDFYLMTWLTLAALPLLLLFRVPGKSQQRKHKLAEDPTEAEPEMLPDH